MSQKLIQSQEQKTVQVQRLTQQQMLAVKMLEMPLTELEQSIQAEIDDNPAMESSSPDDAAFAGDSEMESADTSAFATKETPSAGNEASASAGDSDDTVDEAAAAFDAATEREERASALDDALSNIGMDDRMPDADYPSYYGNADSADYEEMVYGEQASFYDKLKEQMVDVDLDDRQREIMEYVIGSLDGDGLLRKSADSISDELAIYHNIYCT